MRPALTIVLPCYNEAAGIVRSLTALRAWFPWRHADPGDRRRQHGSNGGPGAAACGVAGRRTHSRSRPPANGGKGASIRAAIGPAAGEHVVLVDADLAFGRDSIAAVLQGLHGADIAIGNRRHVESRYSVPVRLFGFLYRRHLVGLTFNALVPNRVRLPYRDTPVRLEGVPPRRARTASAAR
jgi:glycosyltransferase involved in cell wall biosynthesis